MDMRVYEPGRERVTLPIDYSSLVIAKCYSAIFVPNINNLIACDCHCLGARIGLVAGEYFGVRDDEISRLGHKFS
jgi:hypothetical protein